MNSGEETTVVYSSLTGSGKYYIYCLEDTPSLIDDDIKNTEHIIYTRIN